MKHLIEYINRMHDSTKFDINNELSTVEFDLNNATEFDQLIGTINPNKENMCPYNGINDVCAQAIEKITQNI